MQSIEDSFLTSKKSSENTKGDSGGPAPYNDQVVGLASWGYGCGFANFPGVYTDLAFFRDWIDANAGQNGGMNC